MCSFDRRGKTCEIENNSEDVRNVLLCSVHVNKNPHNVKNRYRYKIFIKRKLVSL